MLPDWLRGLQESPVTSLARKRLPLQSNSQTGCEILLLKNLPLNPKNRSSSRWNCQPRKFRSGVMGIHFQLVVEQEPAEILSEETQEIRIADAETEPVPVSG